MAINCVFAIYPECILNIVAEFLNCLIVLVDHNRYAGIAIHLYQNKTKVDRKLHCHSHTRSRTRVRFNEERDSIRRLRSIINTDF